LGAGVDDSREGGGGVGIVGEDAGGVDRMARPILIEPLPESTGGMGGVGGVGGEGQWGEAVGSVLSAVKRPDAGEGKGYHHVLETAVHGGWEGDGGGYERSGGGEAGGVNRGGGGAARSLMQLYGAEGSVESTLAALRADLVREHTRLQQELGLSPSSHLLANMRGGQDAARGGRAWAGGKGGGVVSEFVNMQAPSDAGPARRRRWGEGEQLQEEGVGCRSYFQELLDRDQQQFAGKGVVGGWRDDRALQGVGVLAAAKDAAEAPLLIPSGMVAVAGTYVYILMLCNI